MNRQSELERASFSLDAELKDFPGLRCIGAGLAEGQLALYVYVSSAGWRRRDVVPSEWDGFPVVVREMSQPVLG